MDIRHTARTGLFYLEEAIMEVLKETDKPLTARQVALELGVRFLPRKRGIHLVECILFQLLRNNEVKHIVINSVETWQIDDIFDS